MNPFGHGNVRFDYQKPPNKKSELTPDINNGMISVKDKEMMEKRFAFQKTIELHRKIQDLKPNAIFQSQVQRQCSPDKAASSTQDPKRDSFYQTMDTFAGTQKSASLPGGRSTFGLYNEKQGNYESTINNTRIGQDQGYAMLLQDHFHTKPGFNATSPRFNYVKKNMAMAEVPGPGTYERFRTVEGQRGHHQSVDSEARLTGNAGSAAFKNPTTRDDFLSYLASEKKKPADVSPGRYFEQNRPFLKKSYNASLPPPKYV